MKTIPALLSALILITVSGIRNADAQNILKLDETQPVENIIPGNMKFCLGGFRIGSHWLSEEELRHYIGDEVYYETYHGARQQYLAGSVLMGGGAGIVIAAAMLQGIVGSNYPNSAYAQRANAMCLLSYIVGTTSMLTGIPFLAIGSGRLKWVASDYNARQAPVSLDFGACPNGVGLCLKF